MPTGTYRLQLRREFPFPAAAAVADYLLDLGVSHLYLSPILQATPGSAHGYDVIDHSRLSADLGGEEAFVDLTNQLCEMGLGAVADVVPNHMAVPTPASLNTTLWSVLKEGPHSPYGRWFDVDWGSQRGAVLMPLLGSPINECLDRGEITLDTSGAEPVVRYYDHVLPVRPGTEDLPLERLLDAQHYRLAYWRVGDEELNYRRFFDVGTLAGLRMEDPTVFAETSAVLTMHVQDGRLDGLRIDHPDGLADPREYLRRLATATGGAWVVAEKIVEGDETLPMDWPCAGTTGYESLNAVMNVFVRQDGEVPLTALYSELTGDLDDFPTALERAKRQVLDTSLAAEVARLSELAHQICQRELRLRDHTRRGLSEALVELLVAFDRYRAYVVPGEPAPQESVETVTRAADIARQRLAAERHADLDLLVDLALGRRGQDRVLDEFCVRFQQTCGPVMAKGAEDTAFYRWFRLVALNEVGGDPGHFGRSPESFHEFARRLQRDWPVAMTTLSTHDTKRSEDVRARLVTLAEKPELWRRSLESWRAAAEPYRLPELDAATEYFFWQTLVGVLPLSGELDPDRLTAYLEKAVREAKLRTTWTSRDEPYETAVREFALGVLGDEDVKGSVRGFLASVAPSIAAVTLGQKLVQLTMPGVPDVYQGCEIVDLSLVDPDNRRPVDYSRRRQMLQRLDAGERPGTDDLDAAKLLVTSRVMRLRREQADWFGTDATYEPLDASSPHAFGFVRSARVVTLATRLAGVLADAGGWQDATVTLPKGRWVDRLTGRASEGGEAPLAEVLPRYPVALLVAEDA